MTVAELIKELQKLDPNMRVCVNTNVINRPAYFPNVDRLAVINSPEFMNDEKICVIVEERRRIKSPYQD
jgi:hypothetical protein